jgi:hypothetical protein
MPSAMGLPPAPPVAASSRRPLPRRIASLALFALLAGAGGKVPSAHSRRPDSGVKSLQDGDALVFQIATFLSTASAVGLDDATVDDLCERLAVVAAWVEAAERAQDSLDRYQWLPLGAPIPKTQNLLVEEFVPLETPRHVSAVSIRPGEKDVFIQTVRVQGRNGATFDFDLNATVRAEPRRRHVLFLSGETDLARIFVVYGARAAEGESAPGLSLAAGISALPEYGKEALLQLELASRQIRSRDTRAAVAHLRATRGLLAAYGRSRGF